MNKIRFGTKEIIAVIVVIALYVISEWGERYLIGCGLISTAVLDWVKIRVLIVVVSSAIFGPIVGIICGVGGALLVDMMYYSNVRYGEIIAYAMNGYIIGRYRDIFGVLKGEFRGIKLLDFNIIQLLCMIVGAVLFLPLFFFITENANMRESIVIGTKSAVGCFALTGTVGTCILYIISKIRGYRH